MIWAILKEDETLSYCLRGHLDFRLSILKILLTVQSEGLLLGIVGGGVPSGFPRFQTKLLKSIPVLILRPGL